MLSINIWAIIVSAVISFLISAIWYSSFLFGKEWLSLLKISEQDVEKMRERGMGKLYAVHFIASLVSLSVLAFAINMIGIQSASDGAFIGFFAWLGFVAPFSVSDFLWRKSPSRLVIIDTINVLLTLVVSGAIIAAW